MIADQLEELNLNNIDSQSEQNRSIYILRHTQTFIFAIFIVHIVYDINIITKADHL